MDLPEADASAYTLVSAVRQVWRSPYEGSYADGAVAAGRSAMSERGEEVVFVTTAASNLTACETGRRLKQLRGRSTEAPAGGTPALQVAVRNLKTKETTLVSVEYDPATGQPIPDAPVSQSEAERSTGLCTVRPPKRRSSVRQTGLQPAVLGRRVHQRRRHDRRVDGSRRLQAGKDAR